MNLPTAAEVEPLAGPNHARRMQVSRARAAAWLAWSLWALFVALASFSLLLEYANDPQTLPDLSGPLILLAYATVGALVASRRPERTIAAAASCIARQRHNATA